MSTDMKMAAVFGAAKVLVVDDEYYMRKVVRTLLMSIGVGTVYEAPGGLEGLEQIRRYAPDVVIVDWKMPGLDGPGLVRLVRSPSTFCYPAVPIIMLTGHSERSRVIEAARLGVNEFLLKPVSSKALEDRLVAVLIHPRRIVQTADYYGPEPRKVMPTVHAGTDEEITMLD
jgi:two-component system chemotaxis response regulator CheY